MKNITINIPEKYDENIQKLIKNEKASSRSGAVRDALRNFLYKEYENLELLGFFKKEEAKPRLDEKEYTIKKRMS